MIVMWKRQCAVGFGTRLSGLHRHHSRLAMWFTLPLCASFFSWMMLLTNRLVLRLLIHVKKSILLGTQNYSGSDGIFRYIFLVKLVYFNWKTQKLIAY